MGEAPRPTRNDKVDALQAHRVDPAGAPLTTNQGLAIENDQDSLKVGDRGPSLLEDFLLREKITHFDHERIPERVVHARGSGAHGTFQVYDSLATLTKAGFLQDPDARTPVFVRFSTVAGSRGSTDLARDVRGFAVRFFTPEGNYDLVGNNMPVFFIQDAMKFPDLIHAVKPEPHHEMPQAASAHDTFWDFISLMPETTHMIFWVMSDRAIPRSLRMMEGFGVHSFRLVNDRGKSRFVKFHWKPLLGLHSVAWDEAQEISGRDPDFHRRDLWEAIDQGRFPEWELGIQVVEEKDQRSLGIDLLDPTKLIPEELVPVRRIGRMTLDRNPDNFFAETEQVAFHPGNVVPGIDFSDDALLQGRLFSYTDTQLLRLGGPNFHEIPINRPLNRATNNQRDGHMRQAIDVGRVAYQPNSLGGGDPAQVPSSKGGFVSHPARLEGLKARARSPSFNDHFSQARMFLDSQSEHERRHIVSAFQFELGKVETRAIRERMVGILAQVDAGLAAEVGASLGLPRVDTAAVTNAGVPADTPARERQPTKRTPQRPSRALSMTSSPGPGAATRRVAILAAGGYHAKSLARICAALEEAGAIVKIVAPAHGQIVASDGSRRVVDMTLLTTSSVLFDAVHVAGGESSVATLLADARALRFVREANAHCKTIGATGEGVDVLRAAQVLVEDDDPPEGVFHAPDASPDAVALGLAQLAGRRHWSREQAPTP